MFKQILPAVALLLACSSPGYEAPPPDWVVGTYRYSGSGTVAKKFPWKAKADLVLDRDAQYTLSVEVHLDDAKGGDTDSESSYGSYYVEGNRLVLQPVADDGGDNEEFEIRGRTLVPQINWAARLALKGFQIPDPVFVKTDPAE
jgi:hypothetical protein